MMTNFPNCWNPTNENFTFNFYQEIRNFFAFTPILPSHSYVLLFCFLILSYMSLCMCHHINFVWLKTLSPEFNFGHFYGNFGEILSFDTVSLSSSTAFFLKINWHINISGNWVFLHQIHVTSLSQRCNVISTVVSDVGSTSPCEMY